MNLSENDFRKARTTFFYVRSLKRSVLTLSQNKHRLVRVGVDLLQRDHPRPVVIELVPEPLQVPGVPGWPESALEGGVGSPRDFERLVRGCIEADFCKQILVRELLTRPRIFIYYQYQYFCTAQTSKFQQKCVQLFCESVNPNEFFKSFFQNVLPFL